MVSKYGCKSIFLFSQKSIRLFPDRSLAGALKDGAEYWSGQRSTPQPGSCYGPAGQNLGDWTAGCLAAKRILTPRIFGARRSLSIALAGINTATEPGRQTYPNEGARLALREGRSGA